ncbi:MAG: hypothetical protein KGL65_06115, partial [Rhodospirillales bacterium]|nr:hypothetical protein [Rhodospirillales bacterium]
MTDGFNAGEDLEFFHIHRIREIPGRGQHRLENAVEALLRFALARWCVRYIVCGVVSFADLKPRRESDEL